MDQQSQVKNVAQMVRRDLLTPGEVARILRVDPKTVTRWAAATPPKIHSIRTPGGHRRFYAAEIMSIAEGGLPWAKKIPVADASATGILQHPSRDSV